MFERFTEKARRTVFFARYEASQAGSREIGTEHFLLGLIRENSALATQWFGSHAVLDLIRSEIEAQWPQQAREKVSTSVDIPLSHESKRVMTYAAQEADRLGHKHIAPAHLMIGLLREENSVAARVVRRHEMTVDRMVELAKKDQEEAPEAPPGAPPGVSFEPQQSSLIPEICRDLTGAAQAGSFHPLVGREREMESIMHVLGRRNANSPALIGEPGVGKTAIVEGLAQRIAAGQVPEFLLGSRILALDPNALMSETRNRRQLEQRLAALIVEIADQSQALLLVEGLFEPGATAAGGLFGDVLWQLLAALSFGRIQCLATGTPGGYREAVERDASVERHFRAVAIAAPNEAEAIAILMSIKNEFETYHQVTYADGAIETAVLASVEFMPRRHLPEKALDLLDEAGARVQLRYHKDQATGQIVTSQEIEELIAERAGLPVETVRERLKKK